MRYTCDLSPYGSPLAPFFIAEFFSQPQPAGRHLKGRLLIILHSVTLLISWDGKWMEFNRRKIMMLSGNLTICYETLLVCRWFTYNKGVTAGGVMSMPWICSAANPLWACFDARLLEVELYHPWSEVYHGKASDKLWSTNIYIYRNTWFVIKLARFKSLRQFIVYCESTVLALMHIHQMLHMPIGRLEGLSHLRCVWKDCNGVSIVWSLQQLCILQWYSELVAIAEP